MCFSIYYQMLKLAFSLALNPSLPFLFPSRTVPMLSEESTTKQDLLQRHHAQPDLVESNLLVSELGKQSSAPSFDSMKGILNLTQFCSKKKWLCPYGPELVDETHRLTNYVAPLCIDEKRFELFFQPNNMGESLSDADIIEFLKDEKQQWDRIILPTYNPEFFEYLYLHPCEELRLSYSREGLSREDILNISKCTSLRVIDIHTHDVDPDDVRMLQKLPHLEKLMYASGDAWACFDVLNEVPHLNFLQIEGSSDCALDSPAFPFENESLVEALAFINLRKEATRHLRISITRGPIVFATLGQFEHVESIFIEDINALFYNGFDLYILFMSPHIQKSVRHLHFNTIQLDERALSHIAKFKNLRSIDFGGLEITTEQMVAIIHASADHLQSLTIKGCENVGDGLLGAISSCKRLRKAYIAQTAVSCEVVEAYIKAKQPNWGTLEYKEFKPYPIGMQSDQGQMDE